MLVVLLTLAEQVTVCPVSIDVGAQPSELIAGATTGVRTVTVALLVPQADPLQARSVMVFEPADV